MVNTSVNLGVMGIQSVDHIVYMAMFETEETLTLIVTIIVECEP